MEHFKKILIVDDSFNNLILLEDLLSEMDYNVQVAHDGLEAMGMLKKFEPNLILLDLMMPKMSGFELMEKMKQQDNNIPVIIITAKNSDEERQKAIEMGAAEFIAKPVIISEVLKKVKHVLSQST